MRTFYNVMFLFTVVKHIKGFLKADFMTTIKGRMSMPLNLLR